MVYRLTMALVSEGQEGNLGTDWKYKIEAKVFCSGLLSDVTVEVPGALELPQALAKAVEDGGADLRAALTASAPAVADAEQAVLQDRLASIIDRMQYIQRAIRTSGQPASAGEILELKKLGENIAIKVPLTWDGLKACKALSDDGHMVNVTLCFSANQALLAAKAGATFISPFIGRLDDIHLDGTRRERRGDRAHREDLGVDLGQRRLHRRHNRSDDSTRNLHHLR